MMSQRAVPRTTATLALTGLACSLGVGASAAPDKCSVDGNVVTCQGNQSQGVLGGSDRDFVRSTTNLLKVQNLNQNIGVSLGGVGGIDFQINQNYSIGDVEVAFNDPTFSVINSAGPGIVLSSTGNPTTTPRNLTVTANGSVYGGLGSPGVYAFGSGQAGLAGTGDGKAGAGGYRGGIVVVNVGPALGSGIASADGFIDGLTSAVSVTSKGGRGGDGADGFAFSGGSGGAGASSDVAAVYASGRWNLGTGNSPAQTGAPIILIQSIGGRGGNGGFGDFASGGRGGAGGQGGMVQLTGTSGTSLILGDSLRPQEGDQAPALLLLTQGGNGGSGGGSGVGGAGGDGGAGGGGGDILVSGPTFSILTTGFQSHGIAAYSLGGQGGNGGDGSVFDPGSGSGGGTGPSGTVSLSTAGVIQTLGPESYGIVAQSIAGHGGAGGSGGLVVTFGAAGGSAGAGGAVTLTNNAVITTVSDQSVAISVQSIGGGGGSGGSAFSAFYAAGGIGSNGGDGGAVTVTNNARLTTSGNDALGIYAQSIGGAGGDGGNAGGQIVSLGGRGQYASNGGAVKVVNAGAIATGAATSATIQAGSDPTCGTGCSSGILAQSIGGGGGNGGATGGTFLTVGGNAGGGGDGGTVEVDNRAAISTTQINSHAIAAQSIGGGGHGGGAVTASPDIAIAVGGRGAAGGDAAIVNVSSTHGAALSTLGDGSHGILAQSSGGSGGRGGFSVAVAANLASASFAVGGQGGAGGDAAAVTVNTVEASYSGATPNSIYTRGTGANGILAQSHGGGGGTVPSRSAPLPA